MKNILLTLELTGDETPLLNVAGKYASTFGSKLWLLHIAAPDPEFVGYDVGPQYIRDARAEDLREEHKRLQSYASDLEGEGIDTEGLLIQGMTLEMIMAESEKLNIDLIITGHHDHGFMYKAFVGSVSSQIIKKSKIPVLVVPL